MADFFCSISEYMDLVAKQLSICTTESALDIVYICNIPVEANHSHSKI